MTAVLVVFRAIGEDWATFVETLRAHSPEVEAASCQRIEAYRNRKHTDEWEEGVSRLPGQPITMRGAAAKPGTLHC